MKSFIFIITLAMLAGSIFCADHELDKSKTWYLAHNLWYTDPDHIESINRIEGRFLPAGTRIDKLDVIDDISTSNDPEVSFQVRGKYFCVVIDRDDDEDLAMEDLLRRMFTSETFDQLTANLTDTERLNIAQGKVLPGMCKEAVIRTLGFPLDSRFEIPEKNLWKYQWNFSKKVYVIFDAAGLVSKAPKFPE